MDAVLVLNSLLTQTLVLSDRAAGIPLSGYRIGS